MGRIHAATRRSRPDRILSIDLVDLVRTARSETIEQICSFVGVSVDEDMCAWFDANVTHESSHAGGGAGFRCGYVRADR